MPENLRKLYNTLLLVETKGESTKIMAECLRYTEQLIKAAEAATNATRKTETAANNAGKD